MAAAGVGASLLEFMRNYETMLLAPNLTRVASARSAHRPPELMGELTPEQFLMHDEATGKAAKEPPKKPAETP